MTPLINETLIQITYLVASALFILSLQWLSAPGTARRGVRAGEIGMVLAIGGTLLYQGIVDYKWILIALVLGSIIGVPLGLVHMTVEGIVGGQVEARAAIGSIATFFSAPG